MAAAGTRLAIQNMVWYDMNFCRNHVESPTKRSSEILSHLNCLSWVAEVCCILYKYNIYTILIARSADAETAVLNREQKECLYIVTGFRLKEYEEILEKGKHL